jgi:hypothetical protein
MTVVASSASKGRFVVSGAVAGVTSTVVFTVIHDIFISDIWFSLIPMLVVGALCGLCVAWSYALLVSAPSAGSWLRYNLLYVAMFALLGAISVLLFEPVTTMAAVVTANGPPDALIGQALPLTAAFTVGMAILVTLLYRAGWKRFGAVLLTCVVLVLLLGLNVSVIGLVSIPRGSLYLVAEMFELIAALNVVYVVVFLALQWRRLAHQSPNLAFSSWSD